MFCVCSFVICLIIVDLYEQRMSSMIYFQQTLYNSVRRVFPQYDFKCKRLSAQL